MQSSLDQSSKYDPRYVNQDDTINLVGIINRATHVLICMAVSVVKNIYISGCSS